MTTADPRATRLAQLTADAQAIRASALPTDVKRAMPDDIRGEIARLTRERRQLGAQRTNGVSPMVQRKRSEG